MGNILSLENLGGINLSPALVLEMRFGWTKNLSNCYDRHVAFTDFVPNALQWTKKWECKMLQLDMDKLEPGNDTVYYLSSPLTCSYPHYCESCHIYHFFHISNETFNTVKLTPEGKTPLEIREMEEKAKKTTKIERHTTTVPTIETTTTSTASTTLEYGR